MIPLLLALLAAPAAPPKPPVDEVTVIAPIDPKVVATFPADGASVGSGILVIKVVFDQAMTPEGWSYGPFDAGALPDCLARPRLLPDGKTFALLCSLPARTAFAVEINAAPGFLSAGGRAAKPFVLHFSTTAAAVTGVHDALEQAGLTDADDPIMTWNGTAGVSRSPPPASRSPLPQGGKGQDQ